MSNLVQIHPEGLKNLKITREIRSENTFNIFNFEFQLYDDIIEYNNDEGSRLKIEFPTRHLNG